MKHGFRLRVESLSLFMHYVENPPNPWLTHSVEWVGEPPESKLEVFEETETRKIITHNDSPDVGFEYSINCYRGCIHGCTYCFSRPTHEYLGYGAGTDFDRKIVVKVNAPELLRKELLRPSWKGDEIVFSFTSDPYLPLEANYKLTRRCLEVCLEFRNPVGIVTKSALVRRDIDLLATLAREASLGVFFTIPFTDREVARAVEPYAPLPDARFHAMAELAAAGITVGIGIAPVIPGLSTDIPVLLQRAKEAGATQAFINMLRLPGSVAPYFEQKLREKLPTKADRVFARIREARGGKLNSSAFGERMRGKGEYWEAIERLFKIHCERLGFNKKRGHKTSAETTFRRPTAQQTLFG
jgi:DNA repair photolyase